MAKLETWRKTGLCIMTGDLRSQALGSGSRENKNTLKQGQSFAKWLENFDLELSALSLDLLNDVPEYRSDLSPER